MAATSCCVSFTMVAGRAGHRGSASRARRNRWSSGLRRRAFPLPRHRSRTAGSATGRTQWDHGRRPAVAGGDRHRDRRTACAGRRWSLRLPQGSGNSDGSASVRIVSQCGACRGVGAAAGAVADRVADRADRRVRADRADRVAAGQGAEHAAWRREEIARAGVEYALVAGRRAPTRQRTGCPTDAAIDWTFAGAQVRDQRSSMKPARSTSTQPTSTCWPR